MFHHRKPKIETLYFFILALKRNKRKSEEQNRPMMLKKTSGFTGKHRENI